MVCLAWRSPQLAVPGPQPAGAVFAGPRAAHGQGRDAESRRLDGQEGVLRGGSDYGAADHLRGAAVTVIGGRDAKIGHSVLPPADRL